MADCELYPRNGRVVCIKDDEADEITVMQFNVLADGLCDLRHDKGGFILAPPECLPWSYRRNLYEILAEIARYAPDIICLEELDHFDWMQDQLDRLGYSGHFAAKRESPCLECSDLPDGCAIFVNRIKHLHIKHMCAPRYEHDDGRGAALPSNQLALVAHVLQNEQSLVVVACTHLKSTKSHQGEVIRLSQAKQLHAHVLRHGGADIPTIICGDFNATPDDNDKYAAQAIPAMLDLGWTSAYAQAGSTPNYTTWKTRPGVESKHVIDYIFHNDKVQLLRVVDAPEDVEPSGLPSLRYPSDHIALIATFQIT
ncbi:hypothetical protein B5M09_010343 [Aphanomyces astaci]|uniref:Endonuclease/exonuclease/phosphatase domain-containing protein n=1 Tax=Aphanomyces astaci TaxID=112090 RepID=A0A425D6Y1_APHAT|nr:hypothetical protein B5M09_010343 [Aphanomyces astaci]